MPQYSRPIRAVYDLCVQCSRPDRHWCYRSVPRPHQDPNAVDEERDVYDFMLTQADIQDLINEVNTIVKTEIAAARSTWAPFCP